MTAGLRGVLWLERVQSGALKESATSPAKLARPTVLRTTWQGKVPVEALFIPCDTPGCPCQNPALQQAALAAATAVNDLAASLTEKRLVTPLFVN